MKKTLLNPKILSNQILQFDITDEISKVAQEKSQRLGKLKNSITKGDGNLAGYIGQIAFIELFGGKEEDTFDYDIVHPKLGKVEVKTKRTTVDDVRLNYEGSIADYNPNQDYDHVAFFRVNLQKKKGWFCGYVTKDFFKKNSRSMKQGSLDTGSSNNFQFHAGCRNIFYSQCNREVGLK